MSNAFFERSGSDTFAAGPATAGPWSSRAQHGGPPSALAARVIESHEPEAGQRLARVAVDILRPVPVGKVTVRARTVRPGRRVALVEAVMEAEGQEVLHARGWRIARSEGGPPATVGQAAARVTPPEPAGATGPATAAETVEALRGMFSAEQLAGYLSAVDWRFVSGGRFSLSEPARVWARPRIPLIAGEQMSPMSRALLIADSGSGVSAVLDPARFLFINVDLTVVLQRDPGGEWLLLDAVTSLGGGGTGQAETALSDGDGPCGLALQTLLVAPR